MLDFLIHNFDLPIGLRSCDRREDLFGLEVITELFEFVAVRHDGVGDFVSVNDVLVNKLLDLCRSILCSPSS